jgi:membrane protease YdiL (CAAX protease family)
MELYHAIWNQLFRRKWMLGILLILLFGIPRFILVMQSYVSGNSRYVSLIFTAMVITPFIFLRKAGRKKMGMRKPSRPWWLLWGFLLGMGMCLILFSLFRLAYGLQISNAFVYIGNLTASGKGSLAFFLIYQVIVMTFSPFGEELFYRGLVHQTFKEPLGDSGASLVDSGAFALTHLAHFGLVYAAGTWSFLFLPSLIWITSMFLTCLVFTRVKQRSGSILGAIFTHAGFNFGMGCLIFYAL